MWFPVGQAFHGFDHETGNFGFASRKSKDIQIREKPYMIMLIDSQKQRADSKVLPTPRFQARTVGLSADVFVSLRSVLPPATPGREEG